MKLIVQIKKLYLPTYNSDHLTEIRKLHHQEYLNWNNQANTDSKKDPKIKPQHTKKNQNNNNNNNQLHKKGGLFQKEICIVIGDWILNDLNEKKFSEKRPVKIWYFSRAQIKDMYHYIIPILEKEVTNLILDVDTNDAIESIQKNCWSFNTKVFYYRSIKLNIIGNNLEVR